MPKPATTYVNELNAVLDAMTHATADGVQVTAIDLCIWHGPELLVHAHPVLHRLTGAFCRGPAPDGSEEWAAPYHGVTLVWYRDLPVAPLAHLIHGGAGAAVKFMPLPSGD